MRHARIYQIAMLFAVGLLTQAGAFGQVVGATLTGTVSDPSGAAIPKAMVTIRNVATGGSNTVPTNGEGIYSSSNLRPGDYEVSVTAPGFSARQRSQLTLSVGEKQVLNGSRCQVPGRRRWRSSR